MRTHNAAPLRASRAADKRIIFALWHGELLPLLWQHRGEGVAVVISEHRDGEIVARIAESLGYATVRGSTSKGASRALIGLMRAVDDGPRRRDHARRSARPGARVCTGRRRRRAAHRRATSSPFARTASRAWRLEELGQVPHSEAVCPRRRALR